MTVDPGAADGPGRADPALPPRRWPSVLAVIGLVGVIAGYDLAIWGNERLLAQGTVVRLELAPRDPRALLTGDYMALNYRLARDVAAAIGGQPAAPPRDGFVVVQADLRGVAVFVRVQPAPRPVAVGEVALRYRVRDGHVGLGTDAWYFEEGSGARFEPARFGEFRVGSDGTALLTTLLDVSLAPLR